MRSGKCIGILLLVGIFLPPPSKADLAKNQDPDFEWRGRGTLEARGPLKYERDLVQERISLDYQLPSVTLLVPPTDGHVTPRLKLQDIPYQAAERTDECNKVRDQPEFNVAYEFTVERTILELPVSVHGLICAYEIGKGEKRYASREWFQIDLYLEDPSSGPVGYIGRLAHWARLYPKERLHRNDHKEDFQYAVDVDYKQYDDISSRWLTVSVEGSAILPVATPNGVSFSRETFRLPKVFGERYSDSPKLPGTAAYFFHRQKNGRFDSDILIDFEIFLRLRIDEDGDGPKPVGTLFSSMNIGKRGVHRSAFLNFNFDL